MATSVLVYGPSGCGKTKNAEALRKHYKLDRVIDGWEPENVWPITGALILTNVRPSFEQMGNKELKIRSFDEAKKEVGIK